MDDDVTLLREYQSSRSNDAFRRVVERHVDWVYGVVRRQVHDPHLAHDVTQGVFLALARKAGKIRGGEVSLAGWLFRAAQFGAKGALRMERRRRFHERRAASLAGHARPDEAPSLLEQVGPMLEDAVGRLKAGDRDAVLLRFYQQKSHQEVGFAMGVTEEAAKKRVARAVERLRDALRRRGVTVENTALAAGLEHLVGHAPEAIASSVISSLAASGAGSIVAAGIAKEITAMMAVAKAKFVAVCATAVVVGVGGAIAVAAAWDGHDAPAGAGNRVAATSAGGNALSALSPMRVTAERTGNAPAEPPLLEAARRVDVRQVQRLIAAGANANVVGDYGRTTLHEAVELSWPAEKQEDGVAIVKLLLEKGADPMAVDGGGRTPIEMMGARNEKAVAVIREHLEKLLKEAKRSEIPPPLVPGSMVLTAAQ